MRRNYYGTKEIEELKCIIKEKTGYFIRQNYLLNQAFTRSSFSAEQGGENNEILEFIGDQVLNYYVVKIIAKQYGALNYGRGYSFRVRQNRFTMLKQIFVNNEALAKIIDEWGIAEYLIVGKSDYLNEVDKEMKVKADLFEAILGAIAVSSDWDSDILEKAVKNMLSIKERLNSISETEVRPYQFNIDNAVMVLKEVAESGGCSMPVYDYSGPDSIGYDQDGNPRWVCTCTVINEKTGITRQVWASSKKMAKKSAAYLVLSEHFETQNQYGINGRYSTWKYKDGKLMPEHLMREQSEGNQENDIKCKP